MSEEFKFKVLVDRCKVITSIQRHFEPIKNEDGTQGSRMVETPAYHHQFHQVDKMSYVTPLEIPSYEIIGFKPDAKYEVEIIFREVKDENVSDIGTP
jgi:hypothetical protein